MNSPDYTPQIHAKCEECGVTYMGEAKAVNEIMTQHVAKHAPLPDAGPAPDVVEEAYGMAEAWASQVYSWGPDQDWIDEVATDFANTLVVIRQEALDEAIRKVVGKCTGMHLAGKAFCLVCQIREEIEHVRSSDEAVQGE